MNPSISLQDQIYDFINNIINGKQMRKAVANEVNSIDQISVERVL